MKTRTIIAIMMALLLIMATVSAYAAESYVVIKDKNGVCKVIKAVEKTPKTIAGPFKSKEEAMKAKERECGKAEAKPSRR